MLRPSGVVTTPVTSQPRGPGQEAADLAGGRIGGQHHVVADVHVVAGVEGAGRDVGLDPDARRGRRSRGRRASRRRRRGCCRAWRPSARRGSPASTKMFQRKLLAAASEPVSFQRTMWPNTLLARGFAASRCCGAVPRVELLVSVTYTSRVCGCTVDPFGPVHLRGADTVRRQARVRSATSACEANPDAASRPFDALRHLAPLAAAVRVEPRHVQRARVEQREVGGTVGRVVGVARRRTCRRTRSGRRRPCRRPRARRAASVTVAPSCAKRPRAVCFTGVLPGIEGIDLDHPAEAVELVRLAARRGSGRRAPPSGARWRRWAARSGAGRRVCAAAAGPRPKYWLKFSSQVR